MDLKLIQKAEFDYIYEGMTSSFPSDEIREYEDAYSLLDNEKFKGYHIVERNINIGFVTIWDLEDYTFVEHFVIYDKYRNKGFGGKAIDIVNNKFKKVVLEAEIPDTNLSYRRIEFYKRHGFAVNEIDYIQPAYHLTKRPVKMKLLSYPVELENHEKVINKIYTNVYGVK